MSHFTCLVIGENPELQLAPFYEGLETPRYCSATRQQLIEKQRKSDADYLNGRCYTAWMADPEKYEKEANNPAHIEYLKGAPARIERTDDEVHAEAIKYHEAEDIGAEGEVYSTYNPSSKWDWFQLGGRWTGYFKLKPGEFGMVGKPGLMTDAAPSGFADQALKMQIDLDALSVPFAVLANGEWHEKGKMGWWASVSDEKAEEKWKEEVMDLIKVAPDDALFSLYDLHI